MRKHTAVLPTLRTGLWILLAIAFPVLASGQSWYNSAWAHRKQVTIAHGKVSGGSSLTNFPVLYSVASDSNLSAEAQSSGNDILFTASDGVTKLNHEIETYVSSTGQLIAWVQIPTLSATTDTVIYMYYGNSGASNQQNATAVWDSNFKAVYHFPNGTTLTTNDSTSNAANLTTSGSPTAVAGEVGGAIAFSGTSQYAKASGGTVTGAITLEGWFYPKSNSEQVLIGEGSSSAGGGTDWLLNQSTSGNLISTFNGTNDFPSLSPGYTLNAWNQFAVTADGSHIKYYINGTLAATDSGTQEPTGSATYIFLGQSDIFGDDPYKGNLDEIRISATARSAGWITTEYNNESSPSTFLTVGGEQNNGASWYSTSWAQRKQITVNSGQVSGTLTNFPMLYSVTDSNLEGNTQTNGNDILFTASDGVTKLNHEIESYNSLTGTLVAWVQVPSLASGTVIYMYYGNPGATNQQNASAVWDSHYKAVWHLNSGSPSSPDSTSNGFSATLGSSNAYVGGQMALGLNNNGFGTGAAVSVGAGSGLDFTSTSTPTWSFWLKTSTTANSRFLEEPRAGGWGIEYVTTGLIRLITFGGNSASWSNEVATDGNWHYFTFTYDGTNATLYKDGALVSAQAYTNSWTSAASTLVVDGDNVYPTVGSADEIRVSNSVRSAAWIAAEYNNQSAPGSFYTVGAAQGSGSTVTITLATSPTGLSLSVGGANCTAPCTFQWTPGSNQTIAVTTSPQAGATGTQYVYSSWSDGLAQSHSITVPSSATTYTANFTTQYYLTTLAGSGGSITPASEWVNSGTVVPVTATTNSGYTFTGFSGALTGTTTPQNLTMSAAESVTANFSFNTGSTQVTTYTYDVWNNLSGVSMTRGSSTQTRTFVYSGPYLQSATNPENGTITYTYNANNKIATKTDAKGQVVKYTYDSYARLTEVQRYPQGLSNAEDTCQQEQYFYDTNPFDSSYSGQYSAGRPTAIQSYGGSSTYSNGSGNCDTTFIEMYNYSQPGGKIGKRLRLTRTIEIGHAAPAATNLDFNSTYVYDTEGRMTTVQYPGSGPSTAPVTGPNLGWAFDSMGRLNTMTDLAANSTIVSGATYGPSSELLTMAGQVNESRSYNSMLQLTGLTSGSTVSVTYAYSSAQNNGKITSQTDAISGETVQYTYDALNRLASATATNSSWGQSYQYDGFGNLTNQNVTAGSAPSYSASYDANNHGSCVDANGNNTCAVDGAGHGFNYDVENRASGLSNGAVLYNYTPGNKRVWRGLFTSGTLTTDEVTFWSVNGQKLAVYQLTYTNLAQQGQQANYVWYATQTGANYYFGTKLIKNAGGYVGTDRLGSIGKFYPWGQEKPSATTNGTEKFTGYFRDAETTLDYADQRYHAPGTGRFMTPDALTGSASPADPGSWNRYAYTRGDPVNRVDPSGTDDCDPGDTLPCEINVDIPTIDFDVNVEEQLANAIAEADAAFAQQASQMSKNDCPSYLSQSGTFYTCFHQSGTDWNHLTKDLKALDKRLDKDPSCIDFLTQNGAALSGIDDILQHPLYTFTLAGAIASSLANGATRLAGTTFDVPSQTPIIINSNEYQSSNQPTDFLTVLHELAHYFGVIPGEGTTIPGQKVPVSSAQNDQTVLDHCAKTIGVTSGVVR